MNFESQYKFSGVISILIPNIYKSSLWLDEVILYKKYYTEAWTMKSELTLTPSFWIFWKDIGELDTMLDIYSA